MKNKELKKRIIDISYEHKLSHLGSCFNAVDIIFDIFQKLTPNDKFVLSQGHAGLAYFVVAEHFLGIDAVTALEEQGIHPDRMADSQSFVDCSTGSLGQGLPIAVGMAIADRGRNVYCLISDGELGEGSVWEALRIAYEQHTDNLKIYVNINGTSGYKNTDRQILMEDLLKWKNRGLNIEICESHGYEMPFIEGLKAHYHVMDLGDYLKMQEVFE